MNCVQSRGRQCLEVPFRKGVLRLPLSEHKFMVEPITRRHDENRNSRKFGVQGIQDDCASKWANLVLVECIDDCVVPLFAIPNNNSEIVNAFVIYSGDSTDLSISSVRSL